MMNFKLIHLDKFFWAVINRKDRKKILPILFKL